MPRGLCPALTILIGVPGRGLSLQSDIWKYLPLKSEVPVSQSSFITVTNSVL